MIDQSKLRQKKERKLLLGLRSTTLEGQLVVVEYYP